MQQLTDELNAALYPFAFGINDCAAFTGTMLNGIGLPRTLPMNTDGYTIWCPGFLNTYTYEPGPRFTALLDSRLEWAEANNIVNKLGATLFFAEAFIEDPWPSEPLSKKIASSLAELDLWLEQTTARSAATGSNIDESLTATDARDVVAALAGDDNISALGGNDLIYGGQGADTISAGAGNDLIDGGGDSDHMSGGTGHDLYLVDSAGDVVTEETSSGADQVNSSLTYLLGVNLENLRLVGTSAIAGTGNSAANIIRGNKAANTLDGGGGNDRLAGAGGNDTLIGSAGADTFVFSDNGGSDTMTDFANGLDRFDLQAVAGLNSFSQLVMTDTGSGVLVEYGTGSFLIANASDFSSVDATDFLL